MLTKTQPDEIQDYLSDASYLRGGNASRVILPETPEEVTSILNEATQTKAAIRISGAGTGTVAGRVPFGEIVVATHKLHRLQHVVTNDLGGHVTAQAGVVLGD